MKEKIDVKSWKHVNNDDLNYMNQIVSFLRSEYLSKEDNPIWSKEYFEWKIGKINPAGNGYMSIAMIENNVVGVATLSLKRARLNDSDVIIGEMGDCYTSISAIRKSRPYSLSDSNNDPSNYVNKSIFGRLVYELRKRAELDGITVIFGTPNSKAYPGWVNKLNYFEYQKALNYFYVRPTLIFFIRRFPALRYIKSILMMIESLNITFSSLSSTRLQSINVLPGIPTDEDINRLFLLNNFSNGFKIINDSSYVKYRFIHHPFAQYFYFQIYDGQELIGLIITRVLESDTNIKNLAIVQWLGKENIVLQPNVLNKVIGYFNEFEVEKVYTYSSENSRPSSKLRKSFFFKSSKIPIIFANNPDKGMSEHVRFKHFQLQLGDTDAI